ncbi:MAG: hypothetical protein ACYCYK_13880 [Candidatus Dormibacteria bacterium]
MRAGLCIGDLVKHPRDTWAGVASGPIWAYSRDERVWIYFGLDVLDPESGLRNAGPASARRDATVGDADVIVWILYVTLSASARRLPAEADLAIALRRHSFRANCP